MRSVWTVFFYVTCVFVAGALLAPWLYWSAQALAPAGRVFGFLAQQPFHRFVLRSILGLALLGLWPVARYAGIRTWRDLGFWWGRRSFRQLWLGAFLGFVSLALIAFFALLFGVRQWNTAISARHLGESLVRALLAAVVVAFLEEILFRGVLFGTLKRGHSAAMALFGSSSIYAIVHFFRIVEWHGPLTWHSGLQTLALMMQGFIDPQLLVPKFLVLLLAGMTLALAFERTEALWFSIGAHAGWIFWLKIYGVLTVPQSSRLVSFWGTSKLTDGWFAAMVLLVPTLLLWDSRRTRTSHVRVA
jgi:membrane protease YdiL (CAAX protease family)